MIRTLKVISAFCALGTIGIGLYAIVFALLFQSGSVADLGGTISFGMLFLVYSVYAFVPIRKFSGNRNLRYTCIATSVLVITWSGVAVFQTWSGPGHYTHTLIFILVFLAIAVNFVTNALGMMLQRKS
jgi:hypothetical protein